MISVVSYSDEATAEAPGVQAYTDTDGREVSSRCAHCHSSTYSGVAARSVLDGWSGMRPGLPTFPDL